MLPLFLQSPMVMSIMKNGDEADEDSLALAEKTVSFENFLHSPHPYTKVLGERHSAYT